MIQKIFQDFRVPKEKPENLKLSKKPKEIKILTRF